MPVHARRRKIRVTGGAVLALAAVAAVNPLAIGSAHAEPANPRVNLVVTASCAQFADDSVPTRVSVTTVTNPETLQKTVDTDNESATFGALRFRNIPSGAGTKATATVTCEDIDGNEQAFSKAITVKRPATGIQQRVTVS